MKQGLARFWYTFKNRYFRTKPGPGEPLTFLCGSEEELRRVTTWALHTLSSCSPYSSAYYHAAHTDTEGRTTGSLWLEGRRPPTGEEQTWLHLIVQHNQFTGTRWIQVYGFINPFFKREFAELSALIDVTVHPPSAHERAEALLALSEWLDGKVSEQEKCELLQLPDDVEI